MTKQWVFTELVKNETDIEGLISYAIYKYRKNEVATKANSEKKSPEEINALLKTYHETVLSSTSTQQDFRDKAIKIIDTAVQLANANITKMQETKFNEALADLEKQKKSLDKQKIDFERNSKSEIKKAISAELEKIRTAATKIKKESLFMIILKWLGSGFSGIAATTLAIIIALGIMSLTSSDEQKQTLVKNTLTQIMTLYSTPPVSVPKG